jgi:hypothetical protein
MALKTLVAHISESSLPSVSNDLGIRFDRKEVEKYKGGSSNMVLISPATNLLSEDDAVGPEKTFFRIICEIGLRTGDGTVAQGGGQLIITPERFIGMMDNNGTANGKELGFGQASVIFCFSCRRNDVGEPDVKKRRLKPSDFAFASRDGQPVAFKFSVFSAFGAIANNKVSMWHDDKMLKVLSE